MGCSGSKRSEDEPPAAEGVTFARHGSDEKPEGLTADKKTRLEGIFSTWDVDSSGKLEISAFAGATVKLGPHETKVLDKLGEMDDNSDGFVELHEWIKYFTLTASALSDSEFASILDDLDDAGSNMATILSCTRLAREAEQSAPASADAADDAGGESQEPPSMSDERSAKVQELFDTWDYKKEGEISVLKLQESGSLAIGPNETKIFESLEAMDTNGDKLVSREEMMVYFTFAGEHMSDAEFELVVGEMLGLARDETLIASLTAIAQSADSALTDEPDEPEGEVAPLSASRLELLTRLFCVFAKDTTVDIELNMIEEDCKIQVGPVEENLLSKLTQMDENSDGKVTFDELCNFFRLVGSEMSDDDFSLIVEEMIDSASSKSLIKTLQAQGQ